MDSSKRQADHEDDVVDRLSASAEHVKVEMPDASASEAALSSHLAAIIEEQLRVNLRTVEALHTLIGSRPAPLAVPEPPTPKPPLTPTPTDTSAPLEQRRLDLERQGADLFAHCARHAEQIRQFEEEAQLRLHTIAGEIFEQFQGDYNKSIERIELVLKILEEAEARIAALYDQTHDQAEAQHGQEPLLASPPQQESTSHDEPFVLEVPQPQIESKPARPVDESVEQSGAIESVEASPEPAEAEPDSPPQIQHRPPPVTNEELVSPQDAHHPEHRRSTNRLRVESLESNLGPVEDLSRGGACILCSKPLEGEVYFEVTASDVTFAVNAIVAWCERQTWRHYAVGIQFGDISEEDAQKLTRICMETRKQTTMTG